MNVLIDIDIDIDILKSDLIDIDIDIDIFKKCRYIDNRYMAYRYIEHPPYVDLHLEVMWIVEHFVSIFLCLGCNAACADQRLCRSATVWILRLGLLSIS